MYRELCNQILPRQTFKEELINFMSQGLDEHLIFNAEDRFDNTAFIFFPVDVEGFEVSRYAQKGNANFNLEMMTRENLNILTYIVHTFRYKNNQYKNIALEKVIDTNNADFFKSLGFDQSKFLKIKPNGKILLDKKSTEFLRFIEWVKNCPIAPPNDFRNHMFREHVHEKTDFFEEFILKLKNDTRFSFINFEKIKKDKSIKSALRNIFISTKELNGFYDSKNETLIYPLTEIGFSSKDISITYDRHGDYESYSKNLAEFLNILLTESESMRNSDLFALSHEKDPYYIEMTQEFANSQNTSRENALSTIRNHAKNFIGTNHAGEYFHNTVFVVINASTDLAHLAHETIHSISDSIVEYNFKARALNEIITQFLTLKFCQSTNVDSSILMFNNPKCSYNYGCKLLWELLELFEKEIRTDFCSGGKTNMFESAIGYEYNSLLDLATNLLSIKPASLFKKIKEETGIEILNEDDFLSKFNKFENNLSEDTYYDANKFYKTITDLQSICTSVIEQHKSRSNYYSY